MGTKQEEAGLILKLYELRREAVMREARNWFGSEFHPRNAADVTAVLSGPKSAFLRMVTSYWDMAAALVLQGAIDADMFSATNGEHIFIFARLEPFLAEVRQQHGPYLLANVEKVIHAMPNGAERVKQMQARQQAARRPATEAAR
ncbi:MAG: DUF4760 domain-containing protein [Terriglobales bacterium]